MEFWIPNKPGISMFMMCPVVQYLVLNGACKINDHIKVVDAILQWRLVMLGLPCGAIIEKNGMVYMKKL